LLSLPREVARHPTSGEPILAGIGRYGAYVQHGKTYANLGKDEDVLAIGGNRAIDLIVAKESGAGGRRFGAGSGRALGDHPTLGGAVSVKEGRFGAYVNHGKINATLPKGTDTATLTLDDAVAALAAKAAGGGVGGGRLLGEHPKGGPVSVRPGRFGAYVNWGKVNATIPKSTSPDEISLGEAVDLIEEREGRPSGSVGKKAAAKPAKKAPVKAGAAKQPAAKSDPPFKPDIKPAPRPAAAKSKAAPVKKPAAKAKRKA
jgi:DNA topoisomerase I